MHYDGLKNNRPNRWFRGINPVAATVIILAISLVVAVAFSFWASGFIRISTQFEKLDILGASYNGEHGAFEILVRNAGSKPVVVAQVRLNGVPLDMSVWEPVDDPNLTAIYDPVGAPCELASVDGYKVAKCDPGESIVILICPHFGGVEVKSGVLYEIVIVSGGGMLYPTTVYVP